MAHASSMTGAKHIDGVSRIAILRANAIGDFVFCVPALDALRAAYPSAEIVLLARAWHAEFLTGRPGPIDRTIVLPPIAGLSLPAGADAPTTAPADFLTAMHAERFDIAIQLHGGGAASNPFVGQLGARVTAGMRAPDSAPLDRWIRYIYFQNEILRYLEVVALVGAPPVAIEPVIATTERDHAESDGLAPARPFVVLHPGASDERRRWPVERYAELGDRLVRHGYAVVVSGDASDAPLVRTCLAAMHEEAIDGAGRLSLGGLAGLLARAQLVVGNDTGPLHLARAVGTATVTLYWAGNLINGAPMTRDRHRAPASWQIACPVCGVANVDVRCPHDASFLSRISLEEVEEQALDLLGCADHDQPEQTSSNSRSHAATNVARL